jgi:hypothetical protein
MPSADFKNLQMLIITGNPIAKSKDDHENLEHALFTRLSAVLIIKDRES